MPRFITTRWSLIASARDPGSREALAELCQRYWPPVYDYFRYATRSADEAADHTQELFARLLEGGFPTAEPAKGRFRSYLLGACRHYLANQHDRETAQKRGGDRVILSLDHASAESRYFAEPAPQRTPEQLFERRWALTLLNDVLASLRHEYVDAGQDRLFDELRLTLTGGSRPYAMIADELHLTEGAVKVAAHRLRQRYRDRLRTAIAATVADDSEVEDEIRALFSALG